MLALNITSCIQDLDLTKLCERYLLLRFLFQQLCEDKYLGRGYGY